MTIFEWSCLDLIALKGKKYFTLGVLVTGMLLQIQTLGQSRATLKHENRTHHTKKSRHSSDSLWKKDFVITDTSAALVINRIEDINNTLNDINDILENGYDTSEISENMPLYERSMRLIKYNISTLSTTAEGADLDKVKELISGLLKNNEDIMEQPLPQILFRSITMAGADIQVLFCAYDINKWVQLKSDMLQKIYQACQQANIPVTG